MVKSIFNAEHYVWGEKCEGWHLLKSDSLSVIQEKMPAGTFENKHYHNKSQQLFFILNGIATFEIESKEYLVGENESVHIKPGIAHKIKNNSNKDLNFLVISEPKSHGDRINL